MNRLHTISVTVLSTFALSACITRTSYADLYGQAAPISGAARTLVITPATKYINVEGGETVRFVAGDLEFAWTFDVARSVHSFDLNDVAPPGALGRVVRAFVSPDPKYLGGGMRDAE